MTFPMALGVRGGGPVGCIEIVKQLQQQGARVTLLVLWTHMGYFRPRPDVPPEARGEDIEAELRALGVEIEHVPKAWRFARDGVPMRRRVLELLEERSFDLVVGWNQEFAFLPDVLRRRGVRTAAIAAGQYYDMERPRLRDWQQFRIARRVCVIRSLLLRSYGRPDVVFAISNYLADIVSSVFERERQTIEVAYWGVNPVFADARRDPDVAVTRLFFYGSSAPRKGIPDTFAALGRIAAKGNRAWTLKLVSWDREATAKMAREHGIEDRIQMLDPMDHASLVKELEWAQLAILPSRYESFGLACAECQMSGLPVVAYDVGGVKEVVLDGKSGWLVPLGSIDGLVDAIEDAMSDPGRCHAMGDAGREHALSTFTWDRTAKTMLDWIETSARS